MADSAPLLQSPNFPIGTTLLTYRGHPTGASAVCWPPDGSRIASSQDTTVQVWDATTGATLMSYHEHSNHVFAVSWSPDGRRIASGSDQTVQVWNAGTGAQLLTYQWHSRWKDQMVDDSFAELMYDSVVVRAIAWSPDGSRIASGYLQFSFPLKEVGLLQIWDAASGTQVFTYLDYSSGMEVVTWSPDGSCNASGVYLPPSRFNCIALATRQTRQSPLFPKHSACPFLAHCS